MAGTATGAATRPWQLLGVAIPVGLGLLRYLTTSFRIAAGRVELRRGLLNRHVLSTPLDRVRTVDLTASPIHRLLGLTTVRIGTGTASTDEDDRLDLDGLPVERARRAARGAAARRPGRRRARDRRPAPRTPPSAPGAGERVVLRLDPAWVRFAPFTSSGVVIAAAVARCRQPAARLRRRRRRLDLGRVVDDVSGTSAWCWRSPPVVAASSCWSRCSPSVGYLVTNWGFTLTHAAAAPGTCAAACSRRARPASTTSGSAGSASASRSGSGWPAAAGCPRSSPGSTASSRAARCWCRRLRWRSSDRVARRGARHARPGRRAPDRARPAGPHPPLHPRAGAGARAGRGGRACWSRSSGAPYWLLAVAGLAPVAALGLAADRARALGHALGRRDVVSRSGSLNRRRRRPRAPTASSAGTSASTWFQRRAGLTTLVATTAGGRQQVTVLDVPEAAGVDLARRATPDLLEQFIALTRAARDVSRTCARRAGPPGRR